MEKRDLKYKVKTVCEYAMLNGENTDWLNVVESIGDIESEYNSNSGFDFFEDKDFVKLLEELVTAVDVLYTLGDSNESKVFRLYLISKIYDRVIKWKVV